MISVTSLKVIENKKGNIFRALKSSEDSFHGFGEIYFTEINHKEIKGWKKHKEMYSNLIVPVGNVRFYLKSNFDAKVEVYEIGVENYSRLTVPPGYWMSFEGIDKGRNLVVNIASIEHDPLESETIDFLKTEFE